MHKKIIWPFLFLFTIAISYPASCQEKFSNTKSDSLRKGLINKKGSDKISTQLELALQIMENDKHEAQILANSALFGAKSSNNKNLEMRAYFTLGRIYEVLDNKDLSEAYYDTALVITGATGDNWHKGEILFIKV